MQKRYKILITGSSGMLGADLSQELKNDYEIIGADLVHSPQSTVHRFYKADITDNKSITVVVKKVNPDVVIHTAAMTDVDGCELDPKKACKINSIGTKNVALACKIADAALLYISTDFVFDGKKDRPYKESDRTHPLSIYADSKLKGEKEVKKILKRYFILRTSWLYGRNGKNFVDTIIGKAKNEKVLRVVNDQVGSPTYTKDLAWAIHKLIDRVTRAQEHKSTGYGIYHVSNSGSVSWFDYAKEILRLAGSKTKVLPVSSKELNRPAKRPAMSILDNSRFMEFTGCKMRNWREALKDYV
jgi:dTDP-4-dehydrorhamnose reductase